MNNMYSEVRNHLRQQHAMNTQEIHGKKVDNFNKYEYYGYGSVKENKNDTSWSFPLIGKIVIFLTSIMLFSCYIYGGQDVEKGARMAWNEMTEHITQLEKAEPAIKQAMGYVRKAYDEVKDFTETYMNLGE